MRNVKHTFYLVAAGAMLMLALMLATGHAKADPYCPGCAAPVPVPTQPNQLYPPFGGPPVQWQGPQGQGGCFNYGNSGVHCS